MIKQPLLNTFVNNVDMQQTMDEIDGMIQKNSNTYVVAVNVDVVMKIEEDKYLKKIVEEAGLVLVDGKPLVWISKLQKRPVKAKISGSDLIPALCRHAGTKQYSIFILGGKEGVAELAKKELQKKVKEIKIAGTYSPPPGFENDKNELNKINEIINQAKPDILIACLGCPKQEKWIYENHRDYSAKVSICAGATVDFLAGNIKRAPKWMSEHGLEWFYRFLQEPKRLFRRYFIDDMKIFSLVWKYR